MSEAFKEAYITLKQVPVHVIQYGLDSLITEDALALKNQKYLIMMVSGNPGAISHYKYFLSYLYTLVQVPIVGVSLVGHTVPPDNTVPENNEYASLSGQILHKAIFIEKYIPKHTKLILMGHSIGSYIILHLLKLLQPDSIAREIHIFPVIERMKELTRARILRVFFTLFYYPLLLLVCLLSLLSTERKKTLIKMALRRRDYPECIVDGALNLFNVSVVKNLIALFYDEISALRDLDVEIIESNLNRLVFLYGDMDHWCPKSYYEDTLRKFPTGRIHMEFTGVEHAFVVSKSSSDRVAKSVADVIKEIHKPAVGVEHVGLI